MFSRLLLSLCVSLSWVLSLSGTEPPQILGGAPSPAMIQFGPLRVAVPFWWHKVKVTAEVPMLYPEYAVERFVKTKYGFASVSSGRRACKMTGLVLLKLKASPTHLAHCFMKIGEHRTAASIYVALYEMLRVSKRHRWHLAAKREWFLVHMSYNAGEAYATLGNRSEATRYLAIAARYVRFGTMKQDHAIRYYAELAERTLMDLMIMEYMDD